MVSSRFLSPRFPIGPDSPRVLSGRIGRYLFGSPDGCWSNDSGKSAKTNESIPPGGVDLFGWLARLLSWVVDFRWTPIGPDSPRLFSADWFPWFINSLLGWLSDSPRYAPAERLPDQRGALDTPNAGASSPARVARWAQSHRSPIAPGGVSPSLLREKGFVSGPIGSQKMMGVS